MTLLLTKYLTYTIPNLGINIWKTAFDRIKHGEDCWVVVTNFDEKDGAT